MDLHVWLEETVGVRWHKLVDEGDECMPNMKYHTGYRTALLGARHVYLDNFGVDKNMLRAYAIDVQSNLRWMQRDAAAFVGSPEPRFIIIQRRDESRSFENEALERLKQSMSMVVLNGRSLPISVYYGNEGVVETVK